MGIDTIRRKIAIARRKQAEIEERNPDYVQERSEDAATFEQLDLDLIELEAELAAAREAPAS